MLITFLSENEAIGDLAPSNQDTGCSSAARSHARERGKVNNSAVPEMGGGVFHGRMPKSSSDLCDFFHKLEQGSLSNGQWRDM